MAQKRVGSTSDYGQGIPLADGRALLQPTKSSKKNQCKKSNIKQPEMPINTGVSGCFAV